MDVPTFDEVLAVDGVVETCVLRSDVGVMAYHGGSLEQMTDHIASAVADRGDASYYGVVQPPEWTRHIPSVAVDPASSPHLAAFLAHVRVVITIHGFGRRWLMTSLLLGGRNRRLAGEVAVELRRALPAYRIVDDLDEIPTALRGVHPRNPVNLPPEAGVQIELPPRVRGLGPTWWDWEQGFTPHTEALVDALARAVRAA